MNIPFWTIMDSGYPSIFWWGLKPECACLKSHWQDFLHFFKTTWKRSSVLPQRYSPWVGCDFNIWWQVSAHSEKCVISPFFLIHFIILKQKLGVLEAAPDSSFYFSKCLRAFFLENFGRIQAFLLWQKFCSLTASEMKAVCPSDKLHEEHPQSDEAGKPEELWGLGSCFIFIFA